MEGRHLHLSGVPNWRSSASPEATRHRAFRASQSGATLLRLWVWVRAGQLRTDGPPEVPRLWLARPFLGRKGEVQGDSHTELT